MSVKGEGKKVGGRGGVEGWQGLGVVGTEVKEETGRRERRKKTVRGKGRGRKRKGGG